jgi:ribosomal silencing factor RsfS
MNVVINTRDKFQVYDNVTGLSAYSSEQGHSLFDEMIQDLTEEEKESVHTVLTFEHGDEDVTVYLYGTDKWNMS